MDLKRGHRAQRTCLGCGARDDQEAMLRLVIRGEGELRIERHGQGRGGYLHKKEGCWEAFVRRKSLSRAFRSEVGRGAREKLVSPWRQSQEGRQ
ncbi:MAG: YlxR family protein [Deltaproteobacteria bacterium]|nr:YlxR family protein [Deltaproteobacteria bacterium]